MQDGSFNNNATGQLIAMGDNSLGGVAGAVIFNNAGSFTKQTGTGITMLHTGGANTGSINVNEGIISSTSNYTNSGSINISAGKTFVINGGIFNLNNGTNISGAGNFQHVSGNLRINAAAATPATASNFLFSSGVVDGAGTLQINGGMNWQTGTLLSNIVMLEGAVSQKSTSGNAVITGNGTFTNNGSLSWLDGDFRF